MLKGTYEFEVFDFDGFRQGKRFAVASVEEKFFYDSSINSYTDEVQYVDVIVEIVVDEMEYVTKKSTTIGDNQGERFTVRIAHDDASADDYRKMIGGFERIEVDIVDIDHARLQKKQDVMTNQRKEKYIKTDMSLIVYGDVRPMKTPKQQHMSNDQAVAPVPVGK